MDLTWNRTFLRVTSRSVLVVVLIFVAAQSKAQSVTISLDNPNQIAVAPTVGTLTLDFTGTVTMSAGNVLALPSLDNPLNSGHTFALTATLDLAFANYLTTLGPIYTGNLFSVDVPAGTPIDLYAFAAFGGFSQLGIEVASAGGSFASDSAPFSVLVVPEPSTLCFLVLGSLGCLLLARSWPLSSQRKARRR